MPSTATPRLRLENQAAGENLNTWGQPKLNNVIQQVDDAVAGMVTVATLPVTLTAINFQEDQARKAILNVTATGGGTITIPSVSKVYQVRNATPGVVIITTGSGTTASVAAGALVTVICGGTDCFLLRDTEMATKAYADSLAFEAQQGVLPGQSGNAGKFLGTDGTSASWQLVLPAQTSQNGKILSTNGTVASWVTAPVGLPTQTSQAGKYLTTSGTVASWATILQVPSPTGNSGRFLTNNGTVASWADLPAQLPSQSGNGGRYLTTDGTNASWGVLVLVASPSGQSGKVLTNNGTVTSWVDFPVELPTQTGNSGNFLTTNGTIPAWASISQVPSQAGASGQFLTSNGTVASWAAISQVPSVSGQSGKFLTNNGTVASWGDVSQVPSQTGQSGNFLTTNGTTASFAAISQVPSQTGNSGRFLTTNGTTASFAAISQVPSQSGANGFFLTSDGTNASFVNLKAQTITWTGAQTYSAASVFNSTATFNGQTRLAYTPTALATDEAGFLGAPTRNIATAQALVISDAGKAVNKTGTTTIALTIPPNSSVAFPIGTTIVLGNFPASGTTVMTVTRGSGVVLTLAGNTTDANRQINAGGLATIYKRDTDAWVISGGGVQ